MRPASEGSRGVALTETIISLLVLALLVGVAVAVYLKQFRYDPAMFTATVASAEHGTGQHGGGAAAVATTSAAESPFAKIIPTDFEAMGAAETFDKNTLSDKIDGKADLYLEAGFVQMQCQRFARKAKPEEWLEFFVYDMGKGENAFSVFSRQKRPDGKESDLGQFAYTTDNAVFFGHGQYYVEGVAAAKSPEMAAGLQAFSKKFIESKGDSGQVGALAALPQEGLVPGSTKLVLKDAFGSDKLDNVVMGDYNIGDVKLTAFVSPRQTADEAQKMADAHYNNMKDMGAEPVDTGTSDSMRILDVLGEFEFIFAEGNTFAGVHAAKTRDAGAQLAEQLRSALRSKAK